MKQLGNDVPEPVIVAPATINDVAQLAEVSRATASRVLGEYGAVKAETRATVLAAAAELGYVANVIARSMRAGTTQTLGLIIAEIGLSVFDTAMRVVIDSARAHGYQVLVANTNEDLEAERTSIRVMLEKQVDGLIVVPSSVTDLEFLSVASLRGRPVVLLDRTLATLTLASVTGDNRQGAKDAVTHLLDRGHAKIGLVVFTANIQGTTDQRPVGLISSIHDRVEGYYEAMAEAGIQVDPTWVQFTGDAEESASAAVEAILNGGDMPTALLASNANISLAVLRAVKARGAAIGQDISLIGFDDAPWASIITPSLTVVNLPIEQMAKAAVDNLIGQISVDVRSPGSVVLPMNLVVRESVADLRPALAP
jgi:LacI family transcriptional regulator